MSDKQTIARMHLVIPAMILCIIGDYCIGAEPKGAVMVGKIAGSGWLTIADCRIAVSNITGMVGSVLYAIGATAFARFLHEHIREQGDRLWVRLYTAGLGLGCVSFMYFHIACGGLIQHFRVLYDVTGGNAAQAEEAWLRMLMPEAAPLVLMFIGFDVLTSVAWIALVAKGILPVSKLWILSSPLIAIGIGSLLELLPLPFSGINSGFESMGWLGMFICGIGYVRAVSKDNDSKNPK